MVRIQLPANGRRLFGAVVVAGALAAPAIAATTASAATIQLNAACYVSLGGTIPSVTITGTGFGPGDDVEIAGSGDSINADTTADANGDISVTTQGPVAPLNPGARLFTVTATDTNFNTGATFTTAPITGYDTQGGVTLSQSIARFTKKITYNLGGFIPGQKVYAHYLVHDKLTGTHLFGTAAAPCGTLKAKATIYPISGRHPTGTYKVQFDNAKKYSKRALPRFLIKFSPF
jgi:hypothetical protein